MTTVLADTTIEGLLRESGLPRPEAEILLRAILGCERIHLITHAEDAVDPKARAAEASFTRRRSGEPVSYIVGRRNLRSRSASDRRYLVHAPKPNGLSIWRISACAGVIGASPQLGTGSVRSLWLRSAPAGLRIVTTDISARPGGRP